MDETDRIVAAIFAAGICQGKPMNPSDYFRVYDDCLDVVRVREAERKVSARAKALAKAREKKR